MYGNSKAVLNADLSNRSKINNEFFRLKEKKKKKSELEKEKHEYEVGVSKHLENEIDFTMT